jgi:hypothetical protein
VPNGNIPIAKMLGKACCGVKGIVAWDEFLLLKPIKGNNA